MNAASGFPAVTGRDGAPVNHALPVWDVVCGLYLAAGLLAADRHRLRTGEGSRLRVALDDVALATAGNLGYLAEAQFGTPRERLGNQLYGEFGRDFGTADGRVMVAVVTGRQWRDLVSATGLGEVVEALERALRADFGTAGDRYRHREAIGGVLASWFAGRTCAEVEDGLRGTSVLWSRYRDFGEVAADMDGRPLVGTVDQPGVGPHLAPGSPLVFGGQAPPVPAPTLGEDTAGVLRDVLGLAEDEIDDLRARGVAGEP
ncbi:CoA transferase [Actinomadura sp. CNU-125]|uniref:CoA transferase n=1 Tax=Actinomadura sp. CNU-125 TaxID=1904961 RepID=UPI000B12BA72|nr:CoA transferase [Actinomadura sp. CNU-125]